MDPYTKMIVRLKAALDYQKLVDEELCMKCKFGCTANLHRSRTMIEQVLEILGVKDEPHSIDESGGDNLGPCINCR